MNLLEVIHHIIGSNPNVPEPCNFCSHTSSSCSPHQQWLDCCGCSRNVGRFPTLCTRPSSWLRDGPSGVWFENRRRSFPCVKWTSSRAPSATLYSHSLSFGLSCKAGPWEAPTSTLIHSGPAPQRRLFCQLLYSSEHTPRPGQSQTDSPPSPPEPGSHFPLQPPTALHSFSISSAIRRRSFLLWPVCSSRKAGG